jgi:hypothetical protein
MPNTKKSCLEIGPDWLPTAEAINALPEPLRRFIHDLETNVDRRAWCGRTSVPGQSMMLSLQG